VVLIEKSDLTLWYSIMSIAIPKAYIGMLLYQLIQKKMISIKRIEEKTAL